MLRHSFLILGGVAVGAFILGCFAGFNTRIHSVPYEEMARMEALMRARAGVNAMALSPPISPGTAVPRNNPDTRPTYCWVDITHGPVRVKGPLPDSYWSLSVYTPDSLNPFVVSDRDLSPANEFDFIIARNREGPATLPEEARLIELKSNEAAILLRYYVPTPSHIERIDTLRKAASCEPYLHE